MVGKTEIERIRRDTFSYRGWLTSDSFLKRMSAVFGYAIVAYLTLFLILMICAGIIKMLAIFGWT